MDLETLLRGILDEIRASILDEHRAITLTIESFHETPDEIDEDIQDWENYEDILATCYREFNEPKSLRKIAADVLYFESTEGSLSACLDKLSYLETKLRACGERSPTLPKEKMPASERPHARLLTLSYFETKLRARGGNSPTLPKEKMSASKKLSNFKSIEAMMPPRISPGLLQVKIHKFREKIEQQMGSFDLYREIHSLIKHGANVNDPALPFDNALATASAKGYKAVLQFLVEIGIDVSKHKGYDKSPLVLASKNGREEIVHLLIKNDTNVKSSKDLRGLALCVASEEGHSKVVQLLLNNGADVDSRNFNIQGYLYDKSALFIAALHGHLDVVRFLLEHGADINSQGFDDSALSIATRYGHFKIVQLLLEHGASIHSSGFNGSALCIAARHGHLDIAELLLKRGADVNSPRSDESALCLAARHGHLAVMRVLLESPANFNAQLETFDRELRIASSRGLNEVNVKAQKGLCLEVLIAASSSGQLDVVQFLFETRVGVFAQEEINSALREASWNGHWHIMQFFLENGADAKALNLSHIVELLTEDRLRKYLHEKLFQSVASFLLQNTSIRSLLTQAVQRMTLVQDFVRCLVCFIERYGEALCKLTSNSTVFRAAEHIISHPWGIVKAIFSLHISSGQVYETEDGKNWTRNHLSDFVSIVGWWPTRTSTLDERFSLTNMARKEMRGNLRQNDSEFSQDDLHEVEQFISSANGALNSLLSSVYQNVYPDPLEAVKSVLIRGVENFSGPCEVQFHRPWNLDEYLEKEIIRTRNGEVDRSIVGSLLTLSGNTHQVYANSCGVYMKWKWPDTYDILIKAIMERSTLETNEPPISVRELLDPPEKSGFITYKAHANVLFHGQMLISVLAPSVLLTVTLSLPPALRNS